MGTGNALGKAQTIDDLVSLVISGNVYQEDFERSTDPFAPIDESERAEMYFEDLKELFDFLWVSAAPGVVNNNNLDNNALRRFLETVKTISDKLELTTDSNDDDQYSRVFSITDGSSAETLQGSLTQYFMNRTNYAVFMARNLMILRMAMERSDSDIVPFPGFAKGVWQPSTVTGISADTDRPEFAAEFLQTMLSKEVQQLNYGTGLPVTHSGMDAQLEFAQEIRMGTDTEFVLDIDSIVKQLQTVSVSDTVLADMICNSVERLCKGETDIEGAISEIEQNIRIYLAERS